MTAPAKKQVLITSRLYGPHGGETHLLYLCRHLVAQGADVTVVSRMASPVTPLVQARRAIPIRLITSPFARTLRWFRLSTAWALLVWPLCLRRRRFDVIYSLELSWFTRFLRRFLKPDGLMIHNRIGDVPKPGRRIPEALTRLVDVLVVETPLQAAAARVAYAPLHRIVALPLLGHTRAPARVTTPVGNRPLRVAFLGRYHRPKGVHRLLDIWARLVIAPARLDFHGEGQERDALIAAVRTRGLEASVAVHGGWTTGEELAAVMREIDLLVLPSETEGLPVVLLEALAHGVPFVATDVGGVRTLAEDNPDARVVPMDDDALVKAIEEMAQGIRDGTIRGDRLQAYADARYRHDALAREWGRLLLGPEDFFETRRASETRSRG